MMSRASVSSLIEVFWILKMDVRESLKGFELISATKTPDPGLIVNNPEVSRFFNASRIEIRLARNRSTSSRSGGSRSPGFILPLSIESLICRAISSETLPLLTGRKGFIKIGMITVFIPIGKFFVNKINFTSPFFIQEDSSGGYELSSDSKHFIVVKF
jgi:hypothetical protein